MKLPRDWPCFSLQLDKPNNPRRDRWEETLVCWKRHDVSAPSWRSDPPLHANRRRKARVARENNTHVLEELPSTPTTRTFGYHHIRWWWPQTKLGDTEQSNQLCKGNSDDRDPQQEMVLVPGTVSSTTELGSRPATRPKSGLPTIGG